jgi:hypothetical protein
MEDSIVKTRPSPAPVERPGPALLACGLWLRAAFAGASGFAIGLIQLVDGGVKPVSALALAIGGGALAVVGWWRARAALDPAAEAGSSAQPARGSVRSHGLAGTRARAGT